MLDSCMNSTTATSIRTRRLREHPESTDLSQSCREASDLPGKDSSRESVRLFSCPSTPLNPFFSANAHCLRADRRDARVHCRKQKCAYSAQIRCNISLFRINTGSVDILVRVGVPQAIEVVGKAEEQGLANLD